MSALDFLLGFYLFLGVFLGVSLREQESTRALVMYIGMLMTGMVLGLIITVVMYNKGWM